MMKTWKIIGWSLIAGAVGVMIPYTILTSTFNYPDVLRQEAGQVLTAFYNGGSSLIFTWWAFAILGLPLLVAYSLIGKKLNNRIGYMNWVTTIGIISVILQLIGLLRWVFVVPVLANSYVTATNDATKIAATTAFQLIHQFGGVLLGEHLGQLFTIVWTVMVSYAFIKLKLLPKWVSFLGFGAAAIYMLAQLELFATVIPRFPVWDLAGLIGSTLWLVWLVAVGILFVRLKNNPAI